MFSTALHNFAATGDISGIENLIKKGKCSSIDERTTDTSTQTPLHIACYEGHFNMVYFLLSKGANVKACDAYHWTPLHCAANKLHLKICSLLLTRGADPNAVNLESTTPLHYIIRGSYIEELIEVLDLMLERGVDLECRSKFGDTPLMQAAGKGLTESARYLIDHHANISSVNNTKQTALHFAVTSRNIDTILLLLKNGSDINATSDIGTPLEIATKERMDNVIALLCSDTVLTSSTYGAFQSAALAPFRRDDTNRFISLEDVNNSGALLNASLGNAQNNLALNRKNSIIKPEDSQFDPLWFFGNINRTEAETILGSPACEDSSYIRPS